MKIQASSQPSDNGGGRFPQILGLFQGLKIGVSSGCIGETSIFKIIMIDDVTFWSKLDSVYMVSLLDYTPTRRKGAVSIAFVFPSVRPSVRPSSRT